MILFLDHLILYRAAFLFLSQFLGKQFNEEELEVINTITSVLDHVLTRFEISMSEVSVQNFIIDIFVLLKRVKQGTLLKATEKMVILR